MSSNYYEDDYHGDEYVGQSKYQYVLKECKRCGQKVDMSSDHAICNSCADAMERGWEYWFDPAYPANNSNDLANG